MPSPQLLKAAVSGLPCVLYHVVAWELVPRSSGLISTMIAND